MSNLKNINLEVANFAMKCVKEVVEQKTKQQVNPKEYKSLVKKMATLIQKNGLIGTLAFNLSKINKNHHKNVLKNIVEWNIKNVKINTTHQFPKEQMIFKQGNDIQIIQKYIEWMTSLEPKEYRLITKEMMNLFGWMKRFADGMIEEKSESTKGEK